MVHSSPLMLRMSNVMSRLEDGPPSSDGPRYRWRGASKEIDVGAIIYRCAIKMLTDNLFAVFLWLCVELAVRARSGGHVKRSAHRAPL
jgi:hypothetical protein